MSEHRATPQKPVVSQELLQWLQHHYPDRAPSRSDSNRDVWIKCGQAELIRGLLKIFKEQQGKL